MPKPWYVALLEYKAGRVSKEVISVQLTHCISSVCQLPLKTPMSYASSTSLGSQAKVDMV